MMNDEEERESMKRQYVWLADILDYLPVSFMMYDGVDIKMMLWTYISEQILKEDEQAVLMSTDKDFLQLVDEKTIIYHLLKRRFIIRK